MGEAHPDPGLLAADAQAFRNDYAKLTATLEQLESDLRPMIVTWSSSAQEAYLTCRSQWDTAAGELAAVLDTIAQAVARAPAR